jgi:hypothetical protein
MIYCLYNHTQNYCAGVGLYEQMLELKRVLTVSVGESINDTHSIIPYDTETYSRYMEDYND